MAVFSNIAEGTTASVGGTAVTIGSTISTAGDYILTIDTSAMVAGDQFRLYAEGKVKTSGSTIQLWSIPISNAPVNKPASSPRIDRVRSGTEITYKIVRTAGSNTPTFPYSIDGDTSSGTPSVNVTQWNGTNIAGVDTAGYPKVTVKSGTGAGELSLSSGGVLVASLAAGAIASIWNALTSGLTTASSIGKLLVDNVNATISSRSSHAVSDIWAALTSGLTTVGSIGKLLVDRIDAAISTRSSHSAADVADAVWDEAQSGHTTAGTFGQYLDAQVSTVGGGTPPTASAIADEIETRTLAVDVVSIAGSTTAAEVERDFALSFVPATVNGSPTASSFTSGTAGLSSVDDFYNGQYLRFLSGALKGQNRRISNYIGGSKTFEFLGAAGKDDAPFTSAPSASDAFELIGQGSKS